MGVHTPPPPRPPVSTKWVCIPPWLFILFSFSWPVGLEIGKPLVTLVVMMFNYVLWSAIVSTHSSVLLLDWSLYTMGVHAVRVVFALSFHACSLKSSNNEWESSKKNPFKRNSFFTKWVCIPTHPRSLQNGSAYPHDCSFSFLFPVQWV